MAAGNCDSTSIISLKRSAASSVARPGDQVGEDERDEELDPDREHEGYPQPLWKWKSSPRMWRVPIAARLAEAPRAVVRRL